VRCGEESWRFIAAFDRAHARKRSARLRNLDKSFHRARSSRAKEFRRARLTSRYRNKAGRYGSPSREAALDSSLVELIRRIPLPPRSGLRSPEGGQERRERGECNFNPLFAFCLRRIAYFRKSPGRPALVPLWSHALARRCIFHGGDVGKRAGNVGVLRPLDYPPLTDGR